MIALTKRIDDPSGIVSKLIFEDSDAIAEAVVYQYLDRGVICFSVQSGCPVGCIFCGTGKRFIRNLTREEIELQIETWFVLNKYDNIHLGWIGWFSRWRKYAFFPKPNTVYEEDCLRDIAEFCVLMTKQHKNMRRKE